MAINQETWETTGLSITNMSIDTTSLSTTMGEVKSSISDDTRLSKLSISLCTFEKDVWPQFERFLNLLRPKSIQISWDRKARAVSNAWSGRLIQALSSLQTGLESLEFLNLDLRGAETGQLLEMTLKNHKSSLHTLKVMGCLLDSVSIEGLAKGIHHSTARLEKLSLNNCGLSETMLGTLIEHGFSRQRSRITRLEITRNPLNNADAALGLARLVEMMDRLQLLDVSGNRGFLTVEKEEMRNCFGSANGVVANVNAEDELEAIQKAEENKRQLRFAQRFYSAIGNHANLTDLNLMGVHLNNAGAKLLFDALQSRNTVLGSDKTILKTLDLVQNPDLRDGEWFRGVAKLKNLQTLCFSSTLDISEKHLYECLGCNTSLIWLECTGAVFSSGGNEENDSDESKSKSRLQEFQRWCMNRNRFLHKVKVARNFNFNRALWPLVIDKLQLRARYQDAKERTQSNLFDRIQKQVLFSFVVDYHTSWIS